MDEGSGFVPDAVPDPTLDENIVIPSGRGLMLMRAYMSEVCYNDRGNRVYLRYNRSG
ncbi:MAG: ATP-binding protein [Phycisphaerales bacterium]|nr:ATP-binding protein [Phycisphaerales bacterium]